LAQQSFEGEFLNFPLQLLRALLGLSFQILDLPLHRGDLLLLFPDAQAERRLSLSLRLVANCGQLGLHLFLDGQVDLAPGVIEFAFLSYQVRLRLLRFSQLGVPLLEDFGQVADFPGPGIKVGRDEAFGLLGLGRGDLAAFLVEL
jgi:hypothetical protein